MSAKLSRPVLLSPDDFHSVVRLAPLVSIDFIIRNARGEVLLGLRNNEPAKGFYFVPGGIILKQERPHEAFARILKRETNCNASLEDARLLGVYEHFYDANRFGDENLVRTMSCWRMSLNLPMRLRSNLTPSTAKCAGGASAICWSRTGCMKTQRHIFADRK